MNARKTRPDPGQGMHVYAEQRPTVRKLSQQIDDMCEERSITKSGLAERMKVSKSYLSQIMHRGGSVEQIELLAKALNVSPWAFDRYHILSFQTRVQDGDELATACALALIEGQKQSKRAGVIQQMLLLAEEPTKQA